LLIIARFWILTVAFGKLANKLKSASVKLTVASTLSLITCVIFLLFYLKKKRGIEIMKLQEYDSDSIFKIFFTMVGIFNFNVQLLNKTECYKK
jgi:uncharacterized membrane protein